MSLNWMRRSTRSIRKEYRCQHLRGLQGPSDRQERILNQEKLAGASVLVAGGGGGLGGEVCESLAQKGIGTLHCVDSGTVAPSDLNRQKFTLKDLYTWKAPSLCRNVSKRGFLGTKLIAHPCSVQEVAIDKIQPDVIIAAIDMTIPETREYLCRLAHKLEIPLVVSAVNENADFGYVLVQKKGAACWVCVFKPEFSEQVEQQRCPGVGACTDILKTMAGQVLYAIDSIIMHRPRDWNYRTVSLRSSHLCRSLYVNPRINCPVCGGS